MKKPSLRARVLARITRAATAAEDLALSSVVSVASRALRPRVDRLVVLAAASVVASGATSACGGQAVIEAPAFTEGGAGDGAGDARTDQGVIIEAPAFDATPGDAGMDHGVIVEAPAFDAGMDNAVIIEAPAFDAGSKG